MTELTETLYNKDDELRVFIESWIPINVKDSQHVKEAKLEARDEFMRLIASYGDQRELDTLIGLRQYNSTIAVHGGTDSLHASKYVEAVLTEHLDEAIFTLTTKKEKE